MFLGVFTDGRLPFVVPGGWLFKWSISIHLSVPAAAAAVRYATSKGYKNVKLTLTALHILFSSDFFRFLIILRVLFL